MMERFNYATFRTLERAREALEEFFSTGEICEGEHPRIVREIVGGRARYHVTLTVEL